MEKYRDYLRKIYTDTLMGAAWFSWYDFPKYESALVAGDLSVCALEELKKRFLRVVVYEEKQKYAEQSFAAILVCGGLGSKEYNEAFIRLARKMLTSDGVLIWAVDNKWGVRYLCGDCHLSYEGIYLTHGDWGKMFSEAGMSLTNIYGLMPGWHMPRYIFSQSYPIREENLKRLEYHYLDPENMFCNEAEMVSDLVRCESFFFHTNAFLLEYRKAAIGTHVLMGDMSPDKGCEATVLLHYADDKVVKKALFEGGSVEKIYHYNALLQDRGLMTVAQKYENNSIIMPYIKESLVSQIMVQMAAISEEKFRDMLNKFWQCILQSSPTTSISAFPAGDITGEIILKEAYLDLVPTNAFFIDEEYVFFDQEYVYENYPAKFVLYRGLINLYTAEPELSHYVPQEKVKQWFGLDKLWDLFQQVDWKKFVWQVRHYDLYEHYFTHCVSKRHCLARNKGALRRLYKLATEDLFSNLADKTIVLFGAGGRCAAYLEEYGAKYPPAFIIDNQPELWGTFKEGIEIVKPEMLKYRQAEYRVIICSNYVSEMEQQLLGMGIDEYRVY